MSSSQKSNNNFNSTIPSLDADDIGLETEEEEIIEPFDPTKIKIDTRQITIDLVLNRIKYNEINLSPDFQRESDIWNNKAQSRLIESLLIRIPLPAFYIDATNEEKWVVIDGQQRLTTIKNFVLGKSEDELNEEESLEDKFKLSKLEFLTQLNGKTYDELSRSYQRRINETQVTIYLIEKGTPPEVKFNIFRRINTGGLPLSSQEIRHALNQGKSTKTLKNLARSNEFKKAIDNSVKDKRMAARELVLRFLAFKIFPPQQYSYRDMDTFLNKAMQHMNEMSDLDLLQLEKDFLETMKVVVDIFGNDAFRKRYNRQAARSPINKALFESWSVNLSNLTNSQRQNLVKHKELLLGEFMELVNDSAFNASISQSTGNTGNVKHRFEKIKQLVIEISRKK